MKKKLTHTFLFLFCNLLLVGVLSGQMSKDLVDITTKTPIENKEGEPELLPFKERLKALIDKEPIFLNSEISQEEIARLLRTSPSVVEAIMQSDFGQDYDTFINSRRVKSAIKILSEPDMRDLDLEDDRVVDQAIREVSERCGFKSVGYFARQFKKQQGRTIEKFIEEEVAQ